MPVLLASLLACCSTGCVCRNWMPWRHFYSQPVQCVLSPDATKTDVVNHLNMSAARLYAWRSTDVRITARGQGGMPVSLSAVIAVESPRNFRLMANSVAGNEVDLGSNRERFWFWARRGEPKHVVTASHEHIAHAQSQLRVPFQPDWLMEALGVIPIDENTVQLERGGPEAATWRLVSGRISPQGQPVRQVTVVDACTGFVLEQSLLDPHGRQIAKAIFGEHRADPATGIVLPHRIELDWPEAGMALTMHLGQIEVNPTGMPPQTWQLPEIPGYPRLDLERLPLPHHR